MWCKEQIYADAFTLLSPNAFDFFADCLTHNDRSELEDFIGPNVEADESDCRAWGITAAEWHRAIGLAHGYFVAQEEEHREEPEEREEPWDGADEIYEELFGK